MCGSGNGNFVLNKKKYRIACQEQECNESRQVPGPVYEEINLENTSGTIDLSKSLAYQCAVIVHSIDKTKLLQMYACHLPVE